MSSQRFLRSAAVFALLVASYVTAAAAPTASDGGQPQYYELRVYSTKSEQQQKLVSDYWQNAAVPAYNRIGVQTHRRLHRAAKIHPKNKIYVLIPYDSLDVFASVPAKLAADSAYQTDAAEYLAAHESPTRPLNGLKARSTWPLTA